MLIIGVTGGIGSGKTEVCKFFMDLGVPVLRSDDIGKELSDNNRIIRKRLTNLLGPDAYSPEGRLNRPFVAFKIFSNKSLKRKVEEIIHPYVKRERDRRILDLERNGYVMLVIESALLYQAGLDKSVDIVVVVNADEKVRIQRVCRRDSVPENSVRARINTQADIRKKRQVADYVIGNNGTLKELESKVRFLYNIFIEIIKEGRSV